MIIGRGIGATAAGSPYAIGLRGGRRERGALVARSAVNRRQGVDNHASGGVPDTVDASGVCAVMGTGGPAGRAGGGGRRRRRGRVRT